MSSIKLYQTEAHNLAHRKAKRTDGINHKTDYKNLCILGSSTKKSHIWNTCNTAQLYHHRWHLNVWTFLTHFTDWNDFFQNANNFQLLQLVLEIICILMHTTLLVWACLHLVIYVLPKRNEKFAFALHNLCHTFCVLLFQMVVGLHKIMLMMVSE